MHKFAYFPVVLGMLLLSPALWGLKVQVGSFFEIDKITYKKGRLVLPTTRRKYHNIRVLDRETFLWIATCKDQTICKQALEKMPFQIVQIRRAATRPNMWIADVSFAQKWLVTFLVFKNENGYALEAPKVFKFLDLQLQTQVLDALRADLENGK